MKIAETEFGKREERSRGESVAVGGRVLLALVLANVVASVLHYSDNVANFRHYPEPTWLNPHLVDMFWFVMTPFGIAGYWLFQRGRPQVAFPCLWLYILMNLLVLGHYLIAPPWALSLKINLFIIAEAGTALMLGGYLTWVQRFQSKEAGSTPSKGD